MLRTAQLDKEPLCRMCKDKGIVEPATIVDHIEPHGGCWIRFANDANLQSLCKPHHDRDKQREELLAKQPPAVGDDGYPTDGSW